MEMTALPEMIGSLGFPIVCCVAMFWFIQKTLANQTAMMDDLRKSMDKNTETMHSLIQVIGRGEK